MASILICGDLLPTTENIDLFESGNIEELFGHEIISLFNSADLTIANLEGPLTDSNLPIKKSGPNLRASKKAVAGIYRIGFDFLSLANNHILDYGDEGLLSTIETLDSMGIQHFGADINLELASKAKIVVLPDGKKCGLYSCSEFEFTIAGENSPGANYFDDLEITDTIERIKCDCDYLVVLYHGMKELYDYPAPYVQKRCRKMIDKGADIVVCQHSHCIGCHENYKEKEILYGQGDFCFCGSKITKRKHGLIVSVDTISNQVKFIPVYNNGRIVRLLHNESEVIDCFEKRSNEIKDPAFVEKEYSDYAKTMLDAMQTISLGHIGYYIRRLNKYCLTNSIFNEQDSLDLLNLIRCEAHRDLYIRALTDRSLR